MPRLPIFDHCSLQVNLINLNLLKLLSQATYAKIVMNNFSTIIKFGYKFPFHGEFQKNLDTSN